jgi:type II secretion system protein N
LRYSIKPNKTTLFYSAYIIGITIFFLWYLFPSDTLKDYLAYRLGQVNPAIDVTVDRISPVLPPGIKLHEVNISHQNLALFEVESLKIMPALGSLFSDTTAIDFKGRFYEGILSGRAEISAASEGRVIKIDSNFNNVKVQQISALQQLSDHEISGGLGGNIVYATGRTSGKLSGNLNMTNCRVELAAAIFNQDLFEFKNIDTDLALQNRTLVISGFKATGNQLDLILDGRVKLNNAEPAKNALNLTGTVKPHHVFMAKIEKDIPLNLLRQKKSGQTAISFKIDGTLDDPGFSLN